MLKLFIIAHTGYYCPYQLKCLSNACFISSNFSLGANKSAAKRWKNWIILGCQTKLVWSKNILPKFVVYYEPRCQPNNLFLILILLNIGIWGELHQPNTYEKVKQFNSLILDNSASDQVFTWIGMSDLVREGEWRFLDDSLVEFVSSFGGTKTYFGIKIYGHTEHFLSLSAN